MTGWTVERVIARLSGLLLDGLVEPDTPVRLRIRGEEVEVTAAASLLPHLTGGVAYLVPDAEEEAEFRRIGAAS